MKFFLASIVLMIISLVPAAQAAPIFGLGANIVFETSADGRNYEARQPFSVRGGYRFDFMDAYLEYSNFHNSDGSTMAFISREHQEFILWGRKMFYERWPVSPYLALGLGFEIEHVTTDFGTQRIDAQGDPLLMAAAALGVRFAVFENLELLLEGRLAFASDFSPNPMPGLGLAAGLSF